MQRRHGDTWQHWPEDWSRALSLYESGAWESIGFDVTVSPMGNGMWWVVGSWFASRVVLPDAMQVNDTMPCGATLAPSSHSAACVEVNYCTALN